MGTLRQVFETTAVWWMRIVLKTTFSARRFLCLAVLMVVLPVFAHAQLDVDDFGEDSRLNTNLGLTITAPLNPTVQFVNIGWGFTAGAGYNFNRNNAFVGEFMWNHFYPTAEALHPIRIAFQDPGIDGSGNLFAFTANYRLEFRGTGTGVYFIAGGGLYYRNAHISRKVISGQSFECTREWIWFGFQCSNGVVTTDQTLASSSSTNLGGNAGLGFTFGWGDPPYRFYMEARYHYVPTKNINTQIIPITFGVRF